MVGTGDDYHVLHAARQVVRVPVVHVEVQGPQNPWSFVFRVFCSSAWKKIQFGQLKADDWTNMAENGEKEVYLWRKRSVFMSSRIKVKLKKVNIIIIINNNILLLGKQLLKFLAGFSKL